MKEDELQGMISFLTTAVLNKDIQLDQIRPQLEAKGLNKEIIKKVVASVDDAILNHELDKIKSGREFKFTATGIGSILAIVGAVLIFLNSLGVQNTEEIGFGGYSLITTGLSAIFIKKVKVRTAKFQNKNKFTNAK